MDILGIVFLVLIALAVIAVVVMVIGSASDIRRYMRIRRM